MSTQPNKNNNSNGRDELEANIDPGANTGHLIADTLKDHTKGVNAVLFEIVQNSIDSFWYAKSEGLIENAALDINFRVHPNEGIVEAWDNAGGMTKQVLKENYLKIGNPGDYKKGADTGGSQGKGFWAMTCWGTESYVHTYDVDGNQWYAKAVQSGRQADRTPIKHISKLSRSPREELSQPGTYLRIEDLDQHTMDDLSDWELVNHKLATKFAFALTHDTITINYEIVGDDVYHPDTYDIEEMFEQGGIVENEDLPTFTKKGEERQLKSLHLIDNRKLPDSEEPPWEGIAMLKGGEYTDKHPYLSVWEYIPHKNAITRDGKMFGWVDAGELCPDMEEHGHTGFRGSSIYQDSGLRSAIIQATSEHFNNQSVEEQEEASQFGVDNINHFLKEFDDVSGSVDDGPESAPTSPQVIPSSDQHENEPGDEVGVSLSVMTPKGCEVDKVHIRGEIIRTTDENGDKTSKAEREQSKEEIKIDEEISYQGDTDPVKVASGVYIPQKKGIYTFRAKLYEHPNQGGVKQFDFNVDAAIKGKPVLSSSYSTFNVGGVERNVESTPSSSSNSGLISSMKYRRGGYESWRADLTTHDEDTYDVWINQDHAEYQAMIDLFDGHTEGDVQRDIGTKWGFMCIFFRRAANDIVDLLDEHNIENSQVRSQIEPIIEERLKDYDQFREDFVERSPLTEDSG